jgi:3-oxoacyl-[acyl-carrier protein] reductase
VKLKGKSAIITGAGKGAGKSMAMLFAEQGAKVVVADIDPVNGEQTVKEIEQHGGTAKFVRFDAGNVQEIQDLVKTSIELFGKIDILVNNAGFIQNLTLSEITVEDWDRMMDVNLRSVFFLSQAVMDHMMQNQYGRIINMASQAGKSGGLKTGAHYAASKAGILCLMKSFAKTLSAHGVTVNCISPGVIETDLSRSVPGIDQIIKAIPIGRAATTLEIAKAALFLASDDASYITGECLDVNGGLLMD